MNEDVLEGNWKMLRGRIREKWGELTDDEVDQIAGKRDRLAGMLQAKYGYTKDEISRQIDDFLREFQPTSDTEHSTH
jgi:uncharacterized protein YjbJ (UPF0337 family)